MDLLHLRATIGLDSSEYEQGLKDAEGKADSMGSKIGSAFSKIGKAVGTAVKIGAAAVGAATTAVGVLTKSAVDGYANFEQLSGGVEKLYGSAADQLMDYANQAYATAGMSANQYMEQATSFSAALINSLGGDTKKAAEMTDVAMRAMSDNVNVFGSNAEDVQNAFQGFAKQNYTMLDNLKLGYGGTKTEMERLIADANAYAEANGKAADLSIDSFADVVQAIQYVQEAQNIAGTTATEAASTVSGSIEMLKASWENLVTGFANPDADLGELFNNVLQSAETAMGNLTPVIERALEGIGETINVALPEILNRIPSLIGEIGTPMIEGGFNLVKTLGEGILNAAPEILSTFTDLIHNVADSIKNSQDFLSAGEEGAGSVASGLISGVGELLSAGLELIEAVAQGFIKGLPTLIKDGMQALTELSGGIRGGVGQFVDGGLALISSLADGLIEGLPAVLDGGATILSDLLSTVIENAPKFVAGGIEVVSKLAVGLIEAIPTLIPRIQQIVDSMFTAFTSVDWLGLGKTVLIAIGNGITALLALIPNLLKQIGENAWNNFKNIDWHAVGKNVVTFILNGIKLLMVDIPNTLRKMGQDGANAIKNFDWVGAGRNIVNGLINGVKALAGQFKNVIINLGKGALDGIKEFFGIHSPSRVMEEQVGQQLALGMIAGLEDERRAVVDASTQMGGELATGIGDGIRKNQAYAKKSAQEIGSAILSEAENRLKTHKIYNNISLKDEMAYWDSVRQQVDAGTQARIDADAKYLSAKKAWDDEIEKVNAKLLTDAQKTLDNYQVYYTMSLKDITDYWAAVRDQTQEGTQARIDADKKVIEAEAKWDKRREEIYENSLKLTQDFNEKYSKVYDDMIVGVDKAFHKYMEDVEKVNTKLAENIKKTDEDLAKEITKINEDLTKEIDKINDNYEKSVNSRFDSIMKSVGLFSEVKFDEQISKSGMTQALQDQVDALTEWDSQLDQLAEKLGDDNPLLKELEAMGVSSVENLKSINNMSESELQKYVELYQKKQAIAQERSKAENEVLRRESDTQIAELEASAEKAIIAAKEKADVLRIQYQEEAKKDRRDLLLALEKSAKETKESAEKQMQELKAQYIADLDNLAWTCRDEGEDVGTLMTQGMKAGIDAGKSSVTEAARNAARAAYQAAMAELQIHSPSRKFMWLGQMVDEGFVSGIVNGAKQIKDEIKNTFGFDDISNNLRTTMASVSGKGVTGGYNQTINITSPTALSPYEVARQTRNATRNMVLALR